MKNLINAFLVTCMVFSFTNADAQILKKVQKRLEDKADKKLEDVLNGKPNNNTQPATSTGTPAMESGTSFLGGSDVIFEDDLSHETVGTMPRYWQTNSTGEVATVNGVDGKWLKLVPNASYQLDTLLALPKKFTLEFDMLTRSNQAADIRNFDFGFSRNNTTRSYIYGVSADQTSVNTSMMFYYDAISTASSDTENSSRLDFSLGNFANAVIHVAIAVDGERMQVYLNGSKVHDALVFLPDTVKHFYISTDRWRNNAAVYVSNLRIAK